MRTPLVAAVALVVAVSACGEDGLGGYIDDVAATTEQMTREAFAALPPGAAPTREQIERVVAARRDALESIAALTPPEQLLPEHLALTTAMEEFVTASEAFLTSTIGLSPDAFLDALDASTGIDTLAAVVSDACGAWERQAKDLGHPIELGC